MGGQACTCGCADYLCDAGESPSCAQLNTVSRQSDDKTPDGKTPSSRADYGTGALFVALALMVWRRLRIWLVRV